jgi:hypothetical protein
MHPIANFIAFQVGWFSCVLGAANGRPELGLLAAGVNVSLHLFYCGRPWLEASLIMAAVLMGLVLDSILVSAGWLHYETGMFMPSLAPYWILAMWALFASTLNVSMRWMHGRPVLAIVMGAVGGPLSYLAGERLGAVEFAQGPWPFIALAIGWAVAMPLLASLAQQFDRASNNRTKDPAESWAVN